MVCFGWIVLLFMTNRACLDSCLWSQAIMVSVLPENPPMRAWSQELGWSKVEIYNPNGSKQFTQRMNINHGQGGKQSQSSCRALGLRAEATNRKTPEAQSAWGKLKATQSIVLCIGSDLAWESQLS